MSSFTSWFTLASRRPQSEPARTEAAAMVAQRTLEVDARVTGVFPQYRQARALDAEGFEYALTRTTPGIDVLSLHEGDHLRCMVETDLRRVLHAKVLA